MYFLSALYSLSLTLWTGGMALFTFILTPVIFKSQERDSASLIVSQLFPYYFLYNLAVSGSALFFFSVSDSAIESRFYSPSLALLSSALAVNLFIVLYLHPEMEKLKQEIRSFQETPDDLPERRAFKKLHGVSAILNLFLIAEGITLIFLHNAALFK